MAEFPALPLWTDAYLGDTTHLTTIEHGAYLLLLMTAWRTRDCALPDDDRLLARYARCGPQQWKRLRGILAPFFNIEDGVWTQRRLTDERGTVERYRQQQIEKGKAGAVAKSLKRQERDKAGAKLGLPTGEAQGLAEGEAQGQPDASSHLHTQGSEDKSSAQSAADPVKQVFDIGVSLLTSTGTTEKQARSLIGKWRKAKNDDGAVLTALLDCQARRISEPIEWLEKRFRCSSYVSATGYQYRGNERAVMREAEKRADWDTYWQAKANLDGERQAANG
jgi:uncharacterized protein YdaU (DUF1376 family)